MQMMPSACGAKPFTVGVTEVQIGRPVKVWYLTTHEDEVPVLKPHVWPVLAAMAGTASVEVRGAASNNTPFDVARKNHRLI